MPASARAVVRRPPSLGGGLINVATWAMIGLGGLILFYVIYLLWPRWPDAPLADNAPALPIVVGDVVFNVPPGAIRQNVQRHAGTQDRVDLVFVWPTLAPAAVMPKTEAADAPPSTERLFVTIAADRMALTPEERFKTVYPRYADQTAVAGPDGLSMVPFHDGTPYQGEDLLFIPGTPERFIIRCTRDQGLIPGSCMHERLFDGASVTVRFARSSLADWRGVLAGIDRLIELLQPARP